MKKVRALIILLLPALIFSCIKVVEYERPDDGGRIPDRPNDLGVGRVSIGSNITRTQIAEDGRSVKWLHSDKLGVFGRYDGSVYGPAAYEVSELSVDGSTALFTGRLGWKAPSGGHTFYAYYPESNANDPTNIPLPSIAVQTQEGTSVSHLGPLDFIIAEPVEVLSPSDLTAERYLPLTFKHVYSVIEFRFSAVAEEDFGPYVVESVTVETSKEGEYLSYNGQSYVDITKSSSDGDFARIKGSDGSASVTLNINNAPEVPEADSGDYYTAWMMVAPSDSRNTVAKGIKNVTITVNTNNGTFRFRKSGWLLEDGYKYTVDLNLGHDIVRVLSFDEIGNLGRGNINTSEGTRWSGLNMEARATRMILDKHFRPGAAVNIKYIEFTCPDESGTTNVNRYLTDSNLANVDILFLNNNSRPTAVNAQRVLDWLAADRHRVLIVGFEWKDAGAGATRTNWELLKLLGSDVTGYWYNGGNPNASSAELGDTQTNKEDFRVPFNVDDRTSYFFSKGPFTNPAVASSYQPINSLYFLVEDIWWGRAQVHNPNIVSLIDFNNPLSDISNNPKSGWTLDPTGDGKMILGVDPVKRIVYIGDSELFSTQGIPANTYSRASRIGDESGNLSNDFSRFIANLWAWMIEDVVLAP